MSRIKIHLPENLSFFTLIPIRITDINYGGHVGNDTILSIIHESRMHFLKQYQWDEMNIAGTSLIMSDVGIEFKNELFYGDVVKAYVGISDISKVAFSIYYKLVKGENETVVAIAKTGMVCFDYKTRKITKVPEEVISKTSK